MRSVAKEEGEKREDRSVIKEAGKQERSGVKKNKRELEKTEKRKKDKRWKGRGR